MLYQGSALAKNGALDELPKFLTESYQDFHPDDEFVWMDLIPKFSSVD